MDKIELLGGACFSHGPYTFYKAVRIGNERVLRLGSFFLTKLWTDADLVSIGELQLLWIDSRGSANQPLASLRLYFLPENTPDGRRDSHGEDEVLTISEKVVVRVHDLVTWLSPSLEWSWGKEVAFPVMAGPFAVNKKENECDGESVPQILTASGIDFSDVDREENDYEQGIGKNGKKSNDIESTQQTRVVVLSYPRYCRYRALMRRLEGAEPAWLCSSIAAALGGFTALPGTRVLFCRDTFDYPDLETHELLCNHLAPKLKGRPRRKRKKRSVSPGESSNESEASVASTSRYANTTTKGPSSIVRRSERKTSVEEKKFLIDIQNFMNSRGTPIGKMPLLGYRQIDLYIFYTKVQKLGGYDSVSAGRLWKSIYDDMGGNTGSTSAATITRRHYERLLLPYERHLKGSEIKIRPGGRRTKSTSDDVIKMEPTNIPSSPLNIDSSHAREQKVFSTLSLHLHDSGDKPKTETIKTSSSLRSVRVKPERLKSLNTTISSNPPSPPPSSNASNTSSSSTTPSTTPTASQSVLERQLNSSSPPLLMNQLSSTLSAVIAPTAATSAAAAAAAPAAPSSPRPPPPPHHNQISEVPNTVVTLTPPPEKDLKEIKLDNQNAKQQNTATLLAQGKENIPQFLTSEKINPPPNSPEVIDLELESDTSRDKIIIPSFKKRKLEILREGGLEVTAVELDSRPSVIQATITPVTFSSQRKEEQTSSCCSPPSPVSIPKLISVTVTPDIGHMLTSSPAAESNQTQSRKNHHHSSNLNLTNNSSSSSTSSSMMTSAAVATNRRVINLETANNSSLLELYANAVSSSPPEKLNNTSERIILPPKVTQSRSIFTHNERTIYGNPKDILAQQAMQHPATTPAVLDLTSKQQQQFSRPNLEIVRVPVVPRPNPLNFEMMNLVRDKVVVTESSPTVSPSVSPSQRIRSPFNYSMLDSRNNLEITLVNPSKAKSQLTSPLRNGTNHSNSNNNNSNGNNNSHISTINNHHSASNNNSIVVSESTANMQSQSNKLRLSSPVSNGLAVRQTGEMISPYLGGRKNGHQIIPNVPNLNYLSGSYGARTTQSSTTLDRRFKGEPHQLLRIDNSSQSKNQRHQQATAADQDHRRHSTPNMPSGYNPSVVHNHNGFINQLPSATVSAKYLPASVAMLDPVYYSAIYSGLFPPPIPPAGPYLQPEFSAYYKELLAAGHQSRVPSMGQPPAVPTSK